LQHFWESKPVISEHHLQRPVESRHACLRRPLRFRKKKTFRRKNSYSSSNLANDVERVACLAYYLTHYRSIPEFKTLDISKLNTEAAQPKFSNASVPVDNARQKTFLVSTTRGNKQLGALGERFVQALPDREAAKNVMHNLRVRRFKRSKKGRVSAEDTPAVST